MPCNLTYYYGGKFAFFEVSGNLTNREALDILNTLEKIIINKKKFVFVLDCMAVESIPLLKLGFEIIKWMRNNYNRIPGVLLASAIVTSNEMIISTLNWVFKQNKPVSPNLLTSDRNKGIKFVNEYITVKEP